MNKLLVLLGMFMLTACSPQADGKPWAVKEQCIKGVVYYTTGYQLAPAFKPDGTLITCDMGY